MNESYWRKRLINDDLIQVIDRLGFEMMFVPEPNTDRKLLRLEAKPNPRFTSPEFCEPSNVGPWLTAFQQIAGMARVEDDPYVMGQRARIESAEKRIAMLELSMRKKHGGPVGWENKGITEKKLIIREAWDNIAKHKARTIEK